MPEGDNSPPPVSDLKLLLQSKSKGASSPPPVFDLELFLQLNEEYESRPVVAAPRKLDDASRTSAAERRTALLDKRADLRNKRVLEVGCGQGDVAHILARDYGCTVVGVDIKRYPAWETLSHPNLTFRVLDVSQDHDLRAGTFDKIISCVVWEHVQHPYSALKSCRELLANGGQFYLRANLLRSAVASHRYREVYFPWSHLLFSDEVFEQFYRHIGQTPKRPAWVNALSFADYLRYFDLLGLCIEQQWLTQRQLDEALYHRFEDLFSRYPVFDLTLDFFDVLLGRR